jgi:Shikimate 5-dehydrogenase
LVLGTGGSSKAVAYVLKKLGIEFLFVSRTQENSPEMINYKSLLPLTVQEYLIVINTTPVGNVS